MTGIDLIKLKNWAVIGGVTNPNKYAYKIVQKFKDKGFKVYGVHPKGKEGTYKSLRDIKEKIDCIDLCINPNLGLSYLKEAKELGIKYVLIQPGAESVDIINYCEKNGLVAIEGCALVLLNYVQEDILDVYSEDIVAKNANYVDTTGENQGK